MIFRFSVLVNVETFPVEYLYARSPRTLFFDSSIFLRFKLVTVSVSRKVILFVVCISGWVCISFFPVILVTGCKSIKNADIGLIFFLIYKTAKAVLLWWKSEKFRNKFCSFWQTVPKLKTVPVLQVLDWEKRHFRVSVEIPENSSSCYKYRYFYR